MIAAVEWAERKACGPGDTEAFYATDAERQGRALALCGVCPVRAECLAAALANGEDEGIWGGLTADQLVRAPGWKRPRRVDYYRRQWRTA